MPRVVRYPAAVAQGLRPQRSPQCRLGAASKRSRWPLACLVFAMLAMAMLPAGFAEERLASGLGRGSEPPTGFAEPSIEEIARIRQSLGAATPATDAEGERAFVDALRRIAQTPSVTTPSSDSQSSNVPPHTTGGTAATSGTAGFGGTAAFAGTTAFAGTESTAGTDIASTAVDPIQLAVTTLRNSARELDLQAYEFDDQRKRDQARRLRRLAQSLRREADRLEDSPTSTANSANALR